MATPAKSGPTRSTAPRKSTAARSRTRAARSAPPTPPAPEPRPDEQSQAQRYAREPHEAAAKAKRTTRTRVPVPVLGHVDLPPADELAFMAGIGVLAVVGVVEWPVAVVLGAGHALVNRRRNKMLREFGEALERA